MQMIEGGTIEHTTSKEQCKYFGVTEGVYQRGLLKACRTCEISKECYDAVQVEFPIFGCTFAIGISVEKQHEEELTNLLANVEKYIKTRCKKNTYMSNI